MYNKTEEKDFYMYQGQLFETGHGEDPDVEAMKSGKATVAEEPQAPDEDEDNENSLQSRLAAYEKEEDNTETLGTVAWYKHEFDANNIEYGKKATLQQLQDAFMKWHDDAAEADEEGDTDTEEE